MNNLTKVILMLVAGLMLAQCSTYKIKPDMNKSGVVNKTPKWYVDYNHETMFKWQEAASAVSPDMELAVKKATMLAKAKLVDRINGEMNNRTTIKKDEAGTNEDLNVKAGSQDRALVTQKRTSRPSQKRTKWDTSLKWRFEPMLPT